MYNTSDAGRVGMLRRSAAGAGLLAALAGLFTVGANAQTLAQKLAPGDELRPLYATPQDVTEGRRIAVASCAKCHGSEGISASKEVPHLAGQRPAYMMLELRAYKSGERTDKAMEGVVKVLNDQALVQVSAYYASLPPPVPARGATARVPLAKDPVAAGKAAAAGCAGCHGEGGVSKTSGTPSLVGLDPKYLVTSMKGYKSGNRKNELMKSLLSNVGDAEMANISLYFGLQKPVRAQNPAPGNAKVGKEAAASCAGCHGDMGVSSNPANPSLAGQDAQYLASALQAYKDGARSDDTMKGLASGLDDASMKNLAAFYASQTPQAPSVVKPLTVPQLAERCDRCHGVNGNSTDPRLPAIAAQRVDYIEKVLQAYRTAGRKNLQMSAMAAVLSDEDIQGLAGYYARQQARTPVYVVTPVK